MLGKVGEDASGLEEYGKIFRGRKRTRFRRNEM